MAADPGAAPTLSRRRLLGGAATLGGVGVAAAPRRVAALPGRASGAVLTRRQRPRLVVALPDADAAKIRPLVDDYVRLRPVDVELEAGPYASLREKLSINLSQATGAYDLVSIDDPWLPEFAAGGYLLDLEELLDRGGLDPAPDPDLLPGLLALGRAPDGEGLLALPWVGNVQLFARRADVLSGLGLPPPATWDDVLAQARAVDGARRSAGSGPFGFGLRGQAGNPAATSFLPVLRGHGGQLLDAAGEPRLDTPQALAALETHLALAALAPPGVENAGHAELTDLLAAGNLALTADVWPDQLLTLDWATPPAALEIGPQPAQPGARPATLAGAWLLGIPSGGADPEAALDLLLWLTAPAQQTRLLLERRLPATRGSVLRDPEAVAAFPFLPALLAAARLAVPRPRTPFYNDIETILGAHVADAIAGRLPGADALRRANDEIRTRLVREGALDD